MILMTVVANCIFLVQTIRHYFDCFIPLSISYIYIYILFYIVTKKIHIQNSMVNILPYRRNFICRGAQIKKNFLGTAILCFEICKVYRCCGYYSECASLCQKSNSKYTLTSCRETPSFYFLYVTLFDILIYIT